MKPVEQLAAPERVERERILVRVRCEPGGILLINPPVIEHDSGSIFRGCSYSTPEKDREQPDRHVECDDGGDEVDESDHGPCAWIVLLRHVLHRHRGDRQRGRHTEGEDLDLDKAVPCARVEHAVAVAVDERYDKHRDGCRAADDELWPRTLSCEHLRHHEYDQHVRMDETVALLDEDRLVLVLFAMQRRQACASVSLNGERD